MSTHAPVAPLRAGTKKVLNVLHWGDIVNISVLKEIRPNYALWSHYTPNHNFFRMQRAFVKLPCPRIGIRPVSIVLLAYGATDLEVCLVWHEDVVFYRVIFCKQSLHFITKLHSNEVIKSLQFLNSLFFVWVETQFLI